MGKRGDGYGSEYHLRRYLAEHADVLNAAVAEELGTTPDAISWLPFPRRADGSEHEFKGLGFLPQDVEAAAVRKEWQRFWPQKGQQQNWDAVGRADGEWLLVEAKANQPEFCSPPTTAKREGGLPQIERALGEVRRDLGVHRRFGWTGSYYQYTNRLAVLWFLRKNGIGTRLVFVYFTGDEFPDGTPCPQTNEEWERLVEARRLTLGLPRSHALTAYEHHVVLPALSPDRDDRAARQATKGRRGGR
jgi:hypothetical protein